jgi:hypothetical protein
MSFEPIGGHDKPDDTQLKLYDMLLDQLQKHTTIFWQFPVALFAADFLAVDKFLRHPKLLFGIFLINLALVYAFHCMVFYQSAIIDATRLAESRLRETNKDFIPQYGGKRYASIVVLCALWFLTFGLLYLSLLRPGHAVYGGKGV